MKKIPLRAAREAGRMVKYTQCSPQEMQLDDDLEDIAIVSNAAPESVKYGSGSLTANGPRVVPGIITTTGATDRLQSAGRSVSHTRIHTASPALYGTKSSENLKSGSRQSLLESVSSRFLGGTGLTYGAKRR
ncbi:hypothetical protein X975_20716, partial [Stegodyphus mimosarum]